MRTILLEAEGLDGFDSLLDGCGGCLLLPNLPEIQVSKWQITDAFPKLFRELLQAKLNELMADAIDAHDAPCPAPSEPAFERQEDIKACKRLTRWLDRELAKGPSVE